MNQPLPKEAKLPVNRPTYLKRADKEIIEEWFNVFPVASSLNDAVARTAVNLGLTPKEVMNVVKKATLREAAKQQRDEITQAVIKNKVPMMREIIDLSLSSLLGWVSDFKNKGKHLSMTVGEAKQFSAFINDLNTISRLEQGEATQIISNDVNIQVIEKKQETISKIFEVITNDPVMNPNAKIDDE